MKCFMVGTRPEWIHLRAYLDQEPLDKDEYIIVNTGQHRDYAMARQFVDELRIPEPTVNLNSSPVELSRILTRSPGLFAKHRISQVLVIGDTDSALAGALAAHHAKIPLVHIEAGLRCDEPIPEEYNRRCIDTLAQILLAPEDYAARNLRREHSVGQIVRSPNYKVLLFRRLVSNLKVKARSGVPYSLLTLHRQENVDDEVRMKTILKHLSGQDSRIVWPIHPRTIDRLTKYGLEIPANIKVCQPVSYMSMIKLMLQARTVFTDSGGLMPRGF